MKKKIVVKTNFLISIILITGFISTALLGYHANYKTELNSLEQISALTSEGIYYQLMSIFTKPVNISLTMVHDRLLVDYLEKETEHLLDEEYTGLMQEYLNTYKEKYGYDSVFLASAATKRYYNFEGVDRILTEDNPENGWYYGLLDMEEEYQLVVDNDEVKSSSNDITVFVNCKIKDAGGNILGIAGVGLRIEGLMELLREYEEKFGVQTYLLDENGMIQVSTSYSGYDKVDWFTEFGESIEREEILDWHESETDKNFWTEEEQLEEQDFIVTRYLPELSWHLVVKQDTGSIVARMYRNIILSVIVAMIIVAVILIIISWLIKKFNQEIEHLLEEKQVLFRQTTEQLYDHIYELNITKNCAAGESTKRYFESLGVSGEMPYDLALLEIAEKQIKEEYKEGYINMFSPKHVMEEFEKGNRQLQYDFMVKNAYGDYEWMRIDACIVYDEKDENIRMFTYRKYIKKTTENVQTDEMTGLLTKKETERQISEMIAENKKGKYGFYIFDIDNFKSANDQCGHFFGDAVITAFAGMLKSHIPEGNIIGRIGGDEFAAFVRAENVSELKTLASKMAEVLETVYEQEGKSWKISSSIGVAVFPDHGINFETIYKKADHALYLRKRSGKNGYTFYEEKN